ncbi:hypothetical protein [Aliiroseovarius crassostreae]|uniref:hypothetical protein n=1 Tax=Aliiroseovarius crassostreae TaxID=154981 RepID=UPI0021F9D136|nr:hypothetical protein [Aliiroseovarius crassostreae]UWP89099.1 hypothetical protein K3J57_14830 [Aliiroseovarius crassostreae]
MTKDPTKPLLTIGKYVFDIQHDPRLEGELFMFAMLNRNVWGIGLEVRFGPFKFYLERVLAGVPAE